MRNLLLCALVLLAFGVLLERKPAADIPAFSASADRAPWHVSYAPRVPVTESPATKSTAAAASRQAVANGAGATDAKAARRITPPPRSPKAPRRFTADPARKPAPVVPAWRDDAVAIAAVIESSAYQDMVSPIARLYFGYFERSPDVEGLDYYVAQREGGRELDAIANEFAGSREIGVRYGTLDDAAFVDRVFRNVFDGAGDEQQRAYWIGQLESGAMTRGQMMVAFSESPAFRAAIANEVFVSLAYAEILGRCAEPAELTRWVRFLDAGHPGTAVIQGLLATR